MSDLPFMTCFGRAARGDLAALVAGAGAEVEQVVGRRDDLAVVFDEHERVAQVAQALQRAEQPGVVARVQADGRLVEDVEDAGQAAADLARQADALRLAAGERRPAAVEREVVEADVDEEADAVAHLAEQFAGDLLLRPASSSMSANSASASPSGRCAQFAHASATGLPSPKPNRTAAASGRSREPPQAAQGTSVTRWSSRAR